MPKWNLSVQRNLSLNNGHQKQTMQGGGRDAESLEASD